MLPAHEFVEAYLERLEEKRQQRMEQNALGKAKSWADYKHRVGQAQGMAEAAEIATEVWKEMQARE